MQGGATPESTQNPSKEHLGRSQSGNVDGTTNRYTSWRYYWSRYRGRWVWAWCINSLKEGSSRSILNSGPVKQACIPKSIILFKFCSLLARESPSEPLLHLYGYILFILRKCSLIRMHCKYCDDATMAAWKSLSSPWPQTASPSGGCGTQWLSTTQTPRNSRQTAIARASESGAHPWWGSPEPGRGLNEEDPQRWQSWLDSPVKPWTWCSPRRPLFAPAAGSEAWQRCSLLDAAPRPSDLRRSSYPLNTNQRITQREGGRRVIIQGGRQLWYSVPKYSVQINICSSLWQWMNNF